MPSILWAVFILVLCLMPGKDLPSVSIWEADKIAHFAVYLLLAVLTYYGWKKQSRFSWLKQNTVVKLLIATAAYSFVVELLQEALTADRHFDILDALANSAGAVTGSVISVKLFK